MLCQSIPNNSLLSTLVLRVESSCGLQRLAKVEKLIRRGFTPDAVAGRQNDLWPLIVLNHIHVGRSVIGRVRGVLLGLPLYPDRIEHLLKVRVRLGGLFGRAWRRRRRDVVQERFVSHGRATLATIRIRADVDQRQRHCYPKVATSSIISTCFYGLFNPVKTWLRPYMVGQRDQTGHRPLHEFR